MQGDAPFVRGSPSCMQGDAPLARGRWAEARLNWAEGRRAASPLQASPSAQRRPPPSGAAAPRAPRRSLRLGGGDSGRGGRSGSGWFSSGTGSGSGPGLRCGLGTARVRLTEAESHRECGLGCEGGLEQLATAARRRLLCQSGREYLREGRREREGEGARRERTQIRACVRARVSAARGDHGGSACRLKVRVGVRVRLRLRVTWWIGMRARCARRRGRRSR